MIMKILSVIYEKFIEQYHSDFLMNIDMPHEFSGVSREDPDLRNFYKSLTKGFVGLSNRGLNAFLKVAKSFDDKVNSSKTKISSANELENKKIKIIKILIFNRYT